MNTVIIRGDLVSFGKRLGVGHELTTYELKKIIAVGRLNFLQYLYEGPNVYNLKQSTKTAKQWIEQWTCFYAAKADHKHILSWFQENVRPLDQWAYNGAAKRGSLALFKWLKEQGCRCESEPMVCKQVAEEGHLHILKWLKAQGFEWCAWTWIGATHTGNLELMQWLHDSDCPKDTAHYRAAEHNQKKVLIWLAEHGYGDSGDIFGAVRGAASTGHGVLLKWLLEKGYKFDRQSCIANVPEKMHNREEIIALLNAY